MKKEINMNDTLFNKITNPIRQWAKEDNKRGAFVIVFEKLEVNNKAVIESCEVVLGDDCNMVAAAISSQADSPNSVLYPLVNLKLNEFFQKQLRKGRHANG